MVWLFTCFIYLFQRRLTAAMGVAVRRLYEYSRYLRVGGLDLALHARYGLFHFRRRSTLNKAAPSCSNRHLR
jgi:hypothetical protein